jgi:hypothetical protein
MVDEERLNQVVGKMLVDLGGAASAPLVRMDDVLGLYRTLHAEGPMTCKELAQKAKVYERYLRRLERKR